MEENIEEENIEEENLNKSPETQSENSQNEIIPTQDLETINSTQETENMEVHHHAHDPAAPHHKKNWKSYFWEFLMLFLAVFCGSLAEYQLEHVIENHKGIQYVHSLEEDIRIDTEKLSTLIVYFEEKKSGLDSMLVCLKGITDLNNSNGLYNYLKYTTDYPDFIYTDRTMQQMKNSGGLRMIAKESADRIVSYDAAVKRILLTEELELNPNQQSLKRLTVAIFDLSSIPDLDSRFSSGHFHNHLPLLSHDKNVLKQYFNEIYMMNKKIERHIKNLIKARLTAEKLQQYLKEKYPSK